MTDTAPAFRCHHCDATPTEREMSDGWCDACGKRLPDSCAAKPKQADWVKLAKSQSREQSIRGGRALFALFAIGLVAIVGVILAT
jgi:hypothetical protein